MNNLTVRILFFISLLSSLSIQAKIMPGAKIVTKKISDNVYVLLGGQGQGANVGLVIGDEGLLLIDSMRAVSNQRLLKAIRKLSDKPIKYVINTHHHADHSEGNSFFAEMGASIILQESARHSLAKGQLYFKQQLSLDLGTEKLLAVHSVSHTADDLLIVLKNSNAVFMGDNYESNYQILHGIDGVQGQFKFVDLALEQANKSTMIVPGHGQPTTKAKLLSYRNLNQRWFEMITKLEKKGLTLDEMVKNKQVRSLVNQFNGANTSYDITDALLEYLIAPTLADIAAKKMKPFPLSHEQLRSYTGTFYLQDGKKVEVFLKDNDLYIINKKPFAYTAKLLPLSTTKFYLWQWSPEDYLEFAFEDDKVKSVSLHSQGSSWIRK